MLQNVNSRYFVASRISNGYLLVWRLLNAIRPRIAWLICAPRTGKRKEREAL